MMKRQFSHINQQQEDSSNDSIRTGKTGKKYLKPLDSTLEFSKFKNQKRLENINAKRKESLRQNKFDLVLPKKRELVNKLTTNLRSLKQTDSSTATSNTQSKFSKKTVNNRKIRLVSRTKKTKDSSYMGDDSICKVMSNDGDASSQTLVFNGNDSIAKKLGDTSLKKNFSDMVNALANTKDMSMIKSNLESIQEEKKVDQSTGSIKLSKNIKKDQNQRYRKSLVYDCENESQELLEQSQIDDIWSENDPDEIYEEFEKNTKRKKTMKIKNRMDFDEMTSSMFESTKGK
jgi:hypothetical protein